MPVRMAAACVLCACHNAIMSPCRLANGRRARRCAWPPRGRSVLVTGAGTHSCLRERISLPTGRAALKLPTCPPVVVRLAAITGASRPVQWPRVGRLLPVRPCHAIRGKRAAAHVRIATTVTRRSVFACRLRRGANPPSLPYSWGFSG